MPDARPPLDPNASTLSVSVVVATYNRNALLGVLLRCLCEQTLAADRFELVLVDDGSREPARQVLSQHALPFRVQLIEQENTGQAGARDRGIRAASGDIVVIVDDDMVLKEDLLACHLAWHQKGYRVVLGRIKTSQSIDQMPLFERFHASQLDKFATGFEKGLKPRGVHVCTGNVSFRRKDYLDVGGFDRELKRSEDRELGIRLDLLGAPFVFGYDAVTVHDSDHASLDVWLRRAFNYGVYDHQIYEKHPQLDIANPWRFFFHVNPISRPSFLLVVALPAIGSPISSAAWRASEFLDRHGFRRVAIQGVTYVYGLQYFRGLREQCGSLSRALEGLKHCMTQRKATTPSNS